MRYSFGQICLIILLSNCFYSLKAEQSYAQSTFLPLGPVEFETLDAPGHAVVEDHRGFMWFGGREGLYRYDGYDFIHYQHDPEDSTSLSSNYILALEVDQEGLLWIGTSGGGLNRFDPSTKTFTRYRFDPNTPNSLSDDVINTIYEDNSGQIWVGSNSGLNLFRKETNDFISYQHDTTDSTSLSNNQVMAIFKDSHGTLWIGTGSPYLHQTAAGEGGLNRFNPETETFTSYLNDPYDDSTLISNKVLSIFEDSKGSFWVGTLGDGLHSMDRETGRFTRHRFDAKNRDTLSRPFLEGETSVPEGCVTFDCGGVTFIHEDGNGLLWIAGWYGGVNRYDLKSGAMSHHEAANSGLADDNILAVAESRDGTLWIGTWGGVHKTTTSVNRFPLIQKNNRQETNNFGLSGPHITSLYEDTDGVLWTGTFTNGLNLVNSVNGKISNYLHDPEDASSVGSNNIESIYQAQNGSIWISHGPAGSYNLSRFDQSEQRFYQYVHNPDSSDHIIILDLFEDSSGRFWIGSFTSGLYLLNQDGSGVATFYRPTFNESIGISHTSSVYKFYEDSGGTLWIGTDDGLYQLLDGPILSLNHHLPNRQVVELLEDSSGRFWVGTRGDGLHLFDRGRGLTTQFGREEGLPSMKVVGLIEDKVGDIWISTSEGDEHVPIKGKISRFDPETEIFTNFGIQEVGFRFGSTLKGRDGTFYFGGYGGIINFDPSQIREPIRRPPRMALTSLLVQIEGVDSETQNKINNAISQSSEIQLSYSQNDITISYAALSFNQPYETQYEYLLEGLDLDWISAADQRTVRYSGLSPGSYRFRVRAIDSWGLQSVEDATVGLTILHPWWRTWWAYGAYMILFAMGVFAVDRFQRRRLIAKEREKTRQRELEQARVIEKAYHNLEVAHESLKAAQEQLIQQEKLASLGQLTAGIAHEIKNPLNFVNNFSDVSIELVDEARDELKLIKSLKSSSADEIAEEIATILTDVEANLRKIYEHGSRADRIVKSMLQHSRGGEGERQPTDLNALIEEYVHLSYHGMRAGPNSIDCEIEFNLDEKIDEVEINPEEMSRVIMNVCKNAFDAMVKKSNVKSEKGEDYSPILKIRTSQAHRNIMIDIEDNGAGIPEKIRGNILQPFFTTKKGTEGTGLGLSISSNIVKAHGGDIRIESVVDRYTIFQIIMPIVTSEG